MAVSRGTFGKFCRLPDITSPVVLLPYYRAVDSLGLRRSESWSQIIDPAQDFPKQVPGYGDFGQLDRDIAAMTHDLGTDFDELLAQRSAANALLPPIRLTSPSGQKRKSSAGFGMSVVGGKADLNFERLNVCF